MRVFARVMILVSMVFAYSYAGNVKYASKVKSLYKDGSDKVVGRLLPTAQVEVLEQKGDKQVALYYVSNRRILNAGFSKNADVEFKILESFKESESKQEWVKASVELWSENADLVESVEPLYKEAQELFGNCSVCHALHPPKEFNANQWPSVVKSMKSRVGYDSNQEYLVSQYLQVS